LKKVDPVVTVKPQIRKLYSAEALQKRVSELAKDICADMDGEEALLICVLKGAYVFFADLARYMTAPVRCDFMRVASYGGGVASRGSVELLLEPTEPIRDCHVVIVEDIVDTGITLEYVRRRLTDAGAASVRVCALFDKPSRREIDASPDYVGFTIPDVYVVGYGLDWAEQYRELPYVGVLEGAPPA